MEGNGLQCHSVEADIPQGSPVSPILFAIHTAGPMMWVEERVQGVEELSIGDDIGWVAIGKDVNQVVRKLEPCAAERINWASRRDLQFDTVKTEATRFTCRRCHKMHLRPELTAKISVAAGFVRFNKDATWWQGVWMDAHLTLKEHHNRCIKKAWAAEARLHVLTRMHGIVPERARAIQVASVQAVALYGSKLWWEPKEIGRREDLQLRLNWQARITLGSLPTTPLGLLMRDSGLTAVPVVLDSRQQRFAARLASTFEGLEQKETYQHPTSGARICKVIKKEHKRGLEAETMCWPRPEEEQVVKTVKLSDDTAAKREAKRWASEREARVSVGV